MRSPSPLVALLLLTTLGCGSARESAIPVKGCALLDADGDRIVSIGEAADGLFSAYDTDGSGTLTKAEFNAGGDRGSATRDLRRNFGLWNGDRNGVLTREEFVAGMRGDSSLAGIGGSECDALGL